MLPTPTPNFHNINSIINYEDTTSLEPQPKKQKKTTTSASSGPNSIPPSATWNCNDDMLLLNSIQDNFKISIENKYSVKVTKQFLLDRLTILLYKEDEAQRVSMEIKNLTQLKKRENWTFREDDLLVKSVTTQFQELLENNRLIFHSSRTAKSLENRFYKLRKNSNKEKEEREEQMRKQEEVGKMQHFIQNSTSALPLPPPDQLSILGQQQQHANPDHGIFYTK